MMKSLSLSLSLGLLAHINIVPLCLAFQTESSLLLHSRNVPLKQDRTMLYQSSSGGDDNSDTSAKVRFSGFELDKQSASSGSATTSNPLDAALSFISSDIASIALGLLGLILLSIERLTLPDASTLDTNQYQYAEKLGEETRSNLIAVIACGSVLLNGISKLDVTSALAESVELEGVILTEPTTFSSSEDDNPFQNEGETLQWGMESLLKATPAKTVALLQTSNSDNNKWEVLAMAGVVPIEATMERPEILPSTPILDRFLKKDSRETYLPTLQFLPGKTEFTYIPANTQEVLILSVPTTTSTTMAILLGSNCAKSFTPRDVAWCQTLAARLGAVAWTQG